MKTENKHRNAIWERFGKVNQFGNCISSQKCIIFLTPAYASTTEALALFILKLHASWELFYDDFLAVLLSSIFSSHSVERELWFVVVAGVLITREKREKKKKISQWLLNLYLFHHASLCLSFLHFSLIRQLFLFPIKHFYPPSLV